MCKILVIDDAKDNLTVFSILFKMIKIEHGFEYELFLLNPDEQNSIEEYVLKIEPDIIFLDIKLPKKSGIEIFDALRILGYEKPIIAQTASVTKTEVDVYKEIFNDGIVEKPVDDKKIISILSKHGFWEKENVK